MAVQKKSKLSPPMHFEGKDIEEIIKSGLDHFYQLFLKKQVKPLYNGKQIFFDMRTDYDVFDLGMPERFMHIVSIEDKEEYHIYPCNNDISYELCESKCDISKALMNFTLINRIECIYRLSRIHWIPEIIELAAHNDSNIYRWNETERDNKGNKKLYHHIRYNCGMDDFIIILERRNTGNKDDYNFITAFPVFTKRQKSQYEDAYIKYSKK